MTNMSQNIEIQDTTRIDALFERISALIEQARNVVVYTAKSAEVKTRYEVGRYIVEDEHQGERAAYGKQVLKNQSTKLMNRFGDDWSYDTLKRCLFYYQSYENAAIGATPLPQLKNLGESAGNKESMNLEDFEKPTIGIRLCESKKDSLVELTLPKDANIYATPTNSIFGTRHSYRPRLRNG